jgi:DNA (cytosine-5)-methyltransferase 1
MNVLDLFSGIGGFSLGLERAGMKTVAFCEIEEYPRAVLRKHWPDVVCFNDVRMLNRGVLDMLSIDVDVICGGFPCQDISFAGKGAGLEGERSGLWYEFHRLVDEVRPRYAIIENVSALRSRGLDAVLGSLAAIGYDAEWHCIPASAVGAPHRRDRVWIVAYPTSIGCARLADRGSEREDRMAHPYLARLEVGEQGSSGEQPAAIGGGWWQSEPDVGRVAHGVPSRVDRLGALGNAVVPQIPEIIGRAILSYERSGAFIAPSCYTRTIPTRV